MAAAAGEANGLERIDGVNDNSDMYERLYYTTIDRKDNRQK